MEKTEKDLLKQAEVAVAPIARLDESNVNLDVELAASQAELAIERQTREHAVAEFERLRRSVLLCWQSF